MGCSGLILSGPGAVRFLTNEIACRISEERLEQHNRLSSHYIEVLSFYKVEIRETRRRKK
ncbi:hypothetical protein DICVIV_04384 [Dictyocaulus viviparus]|uniref:Uncharacterized protein n=1 Tax=Dictyocaulus viviparus TaxID=29172 RepID=A0A0D8XZY9_DICVI|nr:hypothetical protein DICVIV_04384 [Dictyocaulus viviparus]